MAQRLFFVRVMAHEGERVAGIVEHDEKGLHKYRCSHYSGKVSRQTAWRDWSRHINDLLAEGETAIIYTSDPTAVDPRNRVDYPRLTYKRFGQLRTNTTLNVLCTIATLSKQTKEKRLTRRKMRKRNDGTKYKKRGQRVPKEKEWCKREKTN